jgi:glycosyltransferase involved in cell wall biosynthesis
LRVDSSLDVSLIIPVYKNQESIPHLLKALDELYATLNDTFEVIFVIDGSPDHSYEILLNTLPTHSFRSQVILLSRNFGSFAAVRAGLTAGHGKYFAVIAADLQEPMSLVIEMVCALREENTDVVLAVRQTRADPFLTRVLANVFWYFYKRYIIPEMPKGGVGTVACNRNFRDQLLKLEESHSSLIAQVFWLGHRRKFISYTRHERKHGRSAWTWHKKINYLMDSVFSVTDLPIRLLIHVGGNTALLAGIIGVVVVVSKWLGLIMIPGYAAIILAVIFLGAVNLFGLGIVGSYAWRAYENTKARPLHIILRKHQFNE